jgi:hypothetical protein
MRGVFSSGEGKKKKWGLNRHGNKRAGAQWKE